MKQVKKVLVFRHVPCEGLGTIEPFLKRLKVTIEYCDLFSSSRIPQDPEGYDSVISMGGPMNVDEVSRYPFLKSERTFISDAIRSNIPVLGVCLGAQMIARVLGARVYPGRQKEIGWYPIRLSPLAQNDRVFKTIRNPNPIVFQWHGDTFDLPKGATLLASSNLYPNQAFVYGGSVYAFQFHIEVTPDMIRDWVRKNEAELKALGASISQEEIVDGIGKYESAMAQLAQGIYERLFFRVASVCRPSIAIL